MSELENEKTRAEAVERTAADRTSSANRARLWAGLNRYLAAEAEHEHKAAKRERDTEKAPTPKKPPKHRAP